VKKRTKTIRLRDDLYEELELYAKKENLSIAQLADQLLEKEVTDLARKDIFSPGLKWFVPKGAIIFSRIRIEDISRLEEWLKQGDKIALCPDGKEGELWLVNNTQIPKSETARFTMLTM
jgi:hypothetical protein